MPTEYTGKIYNDTALQRINVDLSKRHLIKYQVEGTTETKHIQVYYLGRLYYSEYTNHLELTAYGRLSDYYVTVDGKIVDTNQSGFFGYLDVTLSSTSCEDGNWIVHVYKDRTNELIGIYPLTDNSILISPLDVLERYNITLIDTSKRYNPISRSYQQPYTTTDMSEHFSFERYDIDYGGKSHVVLIGNELFSKFELSKYRANEYRVMNNPRNSTSILLDREYTSSIGDRLYSLSDYSEVTFINGSNIIIADPLGLSYSDTAYVLNESNEHTEGDVIVSNGRYQYSLSIPGV